VQIKILSTLFAREEGDETSEKFLYFPHILRFVSLMTKSLDLRSIAYIASSVMASETENEKRKTLSHQEMVEKEKIIDSVHVSNQSDAFP
jgi:hypothetical protein